MSNLSQFLPGVLKATQSVVPFVQDGWTVSGTWGKGGASVLQGNPGADTYETLLTINGSGWLDFLGVETQGSVTARQITVQVVVDGTTVLTSASAAGITATNQGKSILGASTAAADAGANVQPIRFNSQLVIKLKDSVGVSGGQAIYYAARTE